VTQRRSDEPGEPRGNVPDRSHDRRHRRPMGDGRRPARRARRRRLHVLYRSAALLPVHPDTPEERQARVVHQQTAAPRTYLAALLKPGCPDPATRPKSTRAPADHTRPNSRRHLMAPRWAYGPHNPRRTEPELVAT